MTETIATLTSRFPRSGRVSWIGIRPERKAPLLSVNEAHICDSGLDGDHRGKPGKRAVTLIQGEHLAAIASLCGLEEIDPALLRRNIVVTGINLVALRNRRFRCGGAILEGADLCAPCSRMEKVLGAGGYNAMRGHGGITARVLEGGLIKLNDQVQAILEDQVADVGTMPSRLTGIF